MKRKVYTDGNGGSSVLIEGLGAYVPEVELEALKDHVVQLQQTIMQCAELVNVDGGTAIEWLIDNHQNLLEQAKGELCA